MYSSDLHASLGHEVGGGVVSMRFPVGLARLTSIRRRGR